MRVLSDQSRTYQGTEKLATAVLVMMLFIIGVYFRHRPKEAELSVDWWVISQLVICLLGGFLGILLIRKRKRLGIGAHSLLVYILAVLCSTLFSSYPVAVFGYWVLLAGATLLTIGLVHQAQTVRDLVRLEKTWLITVCAILFINTVVSYFVTDIEPRYEHEAFRLGMGWVHASNIAYTACYVFCLSFVVRKSWSKVLMWLIRLLLLFVIISTRTRLPLLLCIFAGTMRLVLPQKNMSYTWLMLSCCVVSAVSVAALAVSFNLADTADLFLWFNRGNTANVMTLTGRIPLWLHVIGLVVDDWLRFVFGYGYGISRFAINEGSGLSGWYAYSHNAFLEHIVGMGFVGLVPFIFLISYSARWLINFKVLCKRFSGEFTLRAATVMAVFYISSLVGAHMGTKISPTTVIIIFYILALDKTENLISKNKKT